MGSNGKRVPFNNFSFKYANKTKNSANSLLCSILHLNMLKKRCWHQTWQAAVDLVAELWNVYVCFEKDGFCADAYVAVFAQLSNKLAFKTI